MSCLLPGIIVGWLVINAFLGWSFANRALYAPSTVKRKLHQGLHDKSKSWWQLPILEDIINFKPSFWGSGSSKEIHSFPPMLPLGILISYNFFRTTAMTISLDRETWINTHPSNRKGSTEEISQKYAFPLKRYHENYNYTIFNLNIHLDGYVNCTFLKEQPLPVYLSV